MPKTLVPVVKSHSSARSLMLPPIERPFTLTRDDIPFVAPSVPPKLKIPCATGVPDAALAKPARRTALGWNPTTATGWLCAGLHGLQVVEVLCPEMQACG